MELERWLMKNDMETAELARIVGVTRQVIWKIKKGLAVDPETAQKIHFMTGGCVKPIARARGRKKGAVVNDQNKVVNNSTMVIDLEYR